MEGFLKCDAPSCDYKEPSKAPDPSMIGKPCPKCGASLMTQEDYDEAVKVHAFLSFLKSIGLAREAKASDETTDEAIIMSVNPHAGNLNIQVKGKRA